MNSLVSLEQSLQAETVAAVHENTQGKVVVGVHENRFDGLYGYVLFLGP
jgi:hypothetical protein